MIYELETLLNEEKIFDKKFKNIPYDSVQYGKTTTFDDWTRSDSAGMSFTPEICVQ